MLSTGRRAPNFSHFGCNGEKRLYNDNVFSLARARHFLPLVLIWAALVTALLPLWHHHHNDECGHEERECVVCVVALLPSGDGVPAGREFVVLNERAREVETRPICVLWVELLPVLWICGPPRA